MLRALLPAFAAAAVPRPPVFDVRDHGAVPDGKTLCTHAFEAAVAEVRKAGGGTVYVPSGTYLTAPFNLTSNATLFVDSGATVKASDDERLWPIVAPLPSYGRGRDHDGPRRTSFIGGHHLFNVTLTGNNGTIDGSGERWWREHRSGLERVTRGRLVELTFSDTITVSNITLRNSPFWTLHPYASSRIVIKDLHVFAPTDSPNTDGIDPDSCNDVLIENFYYVGGDDGIAIKSGWDCFGTAFNRPTANVVLRNLTIQPNNCVAIGSEMSGGVENVTVDGVTCVKSRAGMDIKTATSRGGYVRNVTYRGIRLGDVHGNGLTANMNYGSENPLCKGKPKPPPPVISDIRYHDVVQTGESDTAYAFEGTADGNVTGLYLHNVTLRVRKGGRAFKCQDAVGSFVSVSPSLSGCSFMRAQ